MSASSANRISACAAQQEIYERGPIVAEFKVFEDLFSYKFGRVFCLLSPGIHSIRWTL